MPTRLLVLLTLAIAALTGLADAQTISVTTSEFASRYAAWRSQPSDVSRQIEAKFPSVFESRLGGVSKEEEVGKERIKALYWRTIDALVFSADNLDRLKDYAFLMTRPIGGHLDGKEVFLPIAAALEADKSPLDMKQVEAVRTDWDTHDAAKATAALDWLSSLLGLEKRPKRIEVILVPKTTSKEGMTVQTMDGPRIILAAESLKGSDLVEVVLHETLHVLDISNPASGFFVEARKSLTEAKRPAEEVEQLPHTLMFVMASEAVRKFYEPKHVDYGQTHGTYKRGLDKYLKAAKAAYRALPDREKAKAAILPAE